MFSQRIRHVLLHLQNFVTLEWAAVASGQRKRKKLERAKSTRMPHNETPKLADNPTLRGAPETRTSVRRKSS